MMPAQADGRERGAMQMDGIVRQNAGVSIGEHALLRGGTAETAKALCSFQTAQPVLRQRFDRRYLAASFRVCRSQPRIPCA